MSQVGHLQNYWNVCSSISPVFIFVASITILYVNELFTYLPTLVFSQLLSSFFRFICLLSDPFSPFRVAELFTDLWFFILIRLSGNSLLRIEIYYILRTAFARAQFSGCSSTTNAHSQTGLMAVCFKNLTLGALSSRRALSVLVGALFKKFRLLLNKPRRIN